MLETFSMLAAYNEWANRTVYAAAADLSEEQRNRDLGAFFPSVMATLNHLLVADRIWMKRLTGKGEAPNALNAILFDQYAPLRAARIEQDRILIDFIAGLNDDDLAGTFTYTGLTSPVSVTQRIAPVLSHVFNHQTHHRGQVHMMLTVLGRPSLGLDLVYFQRTDEGRKWA